MRILPAALLSLALQAQDPVLVTGHTLLKGTRVQQAAFSHVVPRKVTLQDLQGGEAVLVLQDGSEVRLPCGLERPVAEGPDTTRVVWRFSVPDLPPLKRLTILQGTRELARFQARKSNVPQIDLTASGSAGHLSIGWSPQRPLDSDAETMLVRWSRDGGTTWDEGGVFQNPSEAVGMLELDQLAKVPSGKLVLEFWILQGLTLHRLKLPVTRN